MPPNRADIGGNRRAVPSVGRSGKIAKRIKEAIGSNEVGLKSGIGVSIAIMFLPGVGSLPFAWADPQTLLHRYEQCEQRSR
jgi:hypothetical protein